MIHVILDNKHIYKVFTKEKFEKPLFICNDGALSNN